MNSFFSWLDYSQQDRQKMLDAVELFGEQTTRDELGIGVVRDTFAEVLFPGISTIQTAAKYFLLVPWTFQLLEQRKVSAAKAIQWTRNLEIKTSEALVEHGDTKRVFGRRFCFLTCRPSCTRSLFRRFLLCEVPILVSASSPMYPCILDLVFANTTDAGGQLALAPQLA